MTIAEASQDNFALTSSGASDGLAEVPIESKVVLGADCVFITVRPSQIEMHNLYIYICTQLSDAGFLRCMRCLLQHLDFLSHIAQDQKIEADTLELSIFHKVKMEGECLKIG